MKAILMSIKPQWVAKILNGEKTIEIRKKFPKDYVGWVYIYCTKEQGLVFDSEGKGLVNSKLFPYAKNCPEHDRLINGKVVARFWCDKVEDYVNGHKWSWKSGAPMFGACNDYEYILKDTCLTEDELYDYCEDLSFNAIHITKLKPFDKPKEIKEFGRVVLELRFFNGGEYYEEEKYPLTRAPQSWCYVEI